ncbi:nuclear transport factor 2 family protein [Streptomyces sp. NPDC020800]|uniref:nuclear transport factor 2 family protein n=1 Tax=Streptomyces sp. NPDC020800 TaxID=3365092 RepID=UPI0037A5C3FA
MGRAAALDDRDGHSAQNGRVRHHLGNVVVTTKDATAEVRAYLVRTRNTGESIQMISTGVNTFGLRRSDGGWRIAELTLTLDDAFQGGARQCVRRIIGCLPAAPGFRLGRRRTARPSVRGWSV